MSTFLHINVSIVSEPEDIACVLLLIGRVGMSLDQRTVEARLIKSICKQLAVPLQLAAPFGFECLF